MASASDDATPDPARGSSGPAPHGAGGPADHEESAGAAGIGDEASSNAAAGRKVVALRPQADDALDQFIDYGHTRDNPAGLHRELWYHEQGDRSWLVVTRNTVTHEITSVELARNVARAEGRSK